MVDGDSIVVYCDRTEDLCVFKAKNEYKLEKTGIPAYKLIVEECVVGVEWEGATCSNSADYFVVVNSCPGGLVGVLITVVGHGVSIGKDEVVFSKRVKRVFNSDCINGGIMNEDINKVTANLNVDKSSATNKSDTQNPINKVNLDKDFLPAVSIPSISTVTIPSVKQPAKNQYLTPVLEEDDFMQCDAISSTSSDFEPATSKTSLFDKYYVESRRKQ
ncbi:ORF102 TLP20 [Cydia pomonella granulovirus]|uniref:ORF102 TLP20 n=2 Tax=Cydia pomonella granulosis virus TaxID=28289 RepID=Q91EV3_GVCPM|nr:ORF102 TLP20 [Cydia pomonella granulovirus]AAK70762.1 ORF102 TLP20 [Cydia pomonella granulovirus]AIU36749.1 ORF102 tlp20 [Cydia pomonella granulovirus]AIU37028.1 ORF102 tlp20 [Cydia pomonella granulovirus]AIU37170.1 ORF102 tlp20 [Cydia pomonella granulovirus]AIU37309.1 ORF102 tlp20 [Cydia pomonella granulovirus]